MVDKKIEDLLKTTPDKAKKTYAAIVAVENHTQHVSNKTIDKVMKFSSSHNIEQCFRVLEVDQRRLEHFDANRKKPLTLLATVASEHEARLTVVK